MNQTFFRFDEATESLTENPQQKSFEKNESENDLFYDAEDSSDEFEDAVEDMQFSVLDNAAEVAANATNVLYLKM